MILADLEREALHAFRLQLLEDPETAPDVRHEVTEALMSTDATDLDVDALTAEELDALEIIARKGMGATPEQIASTIARCAVRWVVGVTVRKSGDDAQCPRCGTLGLDEETLDALFERVRERLAHERAHVVADVDVLEGEADEEDGA